MNEIVISELALNKIRGASKKREDNLKYDLSRFSPQSFERLIQSLAIDKFGPATQIFGAGKDGAREATFEGRVEINAQEIWDGYVVVQAKYQDEVGKLPDNAAWLIRQIDLEMAKYDDAVRALRRPDYYVIASNTRLSAAAADCTGKGAGGIDRVQKHLSSWGGKLGIKSCVVWHSDTLNSLLDTAHDVRTSYDFWVTPGDVLSAALRQFKDKSVETYVPNYLRSQLRQNRDVKTKDTGQTTGKKIQLDDIFVDLPLDRGSLLAEVFEDEIEILDSLPSNTQEPLQIMELSHESEEEGFSDFDDYGDYEDGDHQPQLIVKTIIERCCSKFDLAQAGSEIINNERIRNRVVLMGGPGQGKSTISQFLAQIYRARLLQAMTGNSSDIRSIIKSVVTRAQAEGLPFTGPARFPFLVDLPSYADALSKATDAGTELSVLKYISALIARGEDSLSATTLRR